MTKIEYDWHKQYADAEELVPTDAPQPKGHHVQMSCFVDPSHADDVLWQSKKLQQSTKDLQGVDKGHYPGIEAILFPVRFKGLMRSTNLLLLICIMLDLHDGNVG